MGIKKKVIKRSQIQTHFPVGGTIITWLLLDRFKELPGWFVGMVWTLFGLLWLAVIIIAFTQEAVEIDFERIEK